MMFDDLAFILLIVLACVTLWLIVRSIRHRRSTAQIIAATFCVLAIAAVFAGLPQHNRRYEIEQYQRLFTAERVTFSGEDVTELFRSYEHDGMVLTETVPCPLDHVEGVEAGELEFYSDSGRVFQKIVLIRLTEETIGPRIYQADGTSYVFQSTGTFQKYVFALPESIAAQLISLSK